MHQTLFGSRFILKTYILLFFSKVLRLKGNFTSVSSGRLRTGENLFGRLGWLINDSFLVYVNLSLRGHTTYFIDGGMCHQSLS